MALATSNLSVKSILAGLGAASAKAIFYNGATLKTAAEFGGMVSKDGLNGTYCPGADATARLANLLANRRLSYFKGYNPIINYLSCNPQTLLFVKAGGQGFFDILSNLAWTITNAIGWITLSAISGTGNTTITATAAAYGGNIDRSASFTVNAAGFTITITVTQEGSHL